MAFKRLSYADDELLDAAKYQDLATDLNYLFDNQQQVYYHAYDIKKTTGIKIASGVAQHAPHKAKTFSKDIPFGSFFSASCRPVVVCSHAGIGQTTVSMTGMGGHTNIINNTGFRVYVTNMESGKIKSYFPGTNYIHWIAIGW